MEMHLALELQERDMKNLLEKNRNEEIEEEVEVEEGCCFLCFENWVEGLHDITFYTPPVSNMYCQNMRYMPVTTFLY